MEVAHISEASEQRVQDGEKNPASVLQGVGIIHVFALGVSARQFLVPHFQALADCGARQLLVASESPEGREAAERGRLTFCPVSIAQSVSPIKDGCAIGLLYRLFRRESPSIVIAHMSKAAIIAMVASLLAGVKSRVYYNHGMALFSASGVKRAILWLIEKLSCSCATHVVFCSESTKAEAIRLGLVSGKKALVVGHGTISGVDTDLFCPKGPEVKAASRRRLNIPEDKVVIGFVGRQVPHKGVLTLLDAWKLLPETTRQQAALVFVGGMPTPLVADALRLAASQDRSIIIAGKQTDMPAVYAAFDAIVLPSWHEGFPYSLLEAEACGLPAIASDVTGNKDAVVSGVTGVLIPPRNPPALVQALQRLIAEPEQRSSYGAASRDRVCSQFSRRGVINRHVRFYASLVPTA